MLKPEAVSSLIDRTRVGDREALGRLIGQLYDELRAVARGQRYRLGASETVNTTALVHEAYAKLAGAAEREKPVLFTDRAHFFRIAARVMRDIIVDYARAQSSQKRGRGRKHISLEEHATLGKDVEGMDIEEVLNVHMLLDQLKNMDAEAAHVAELRYFAGLTSAQTAEALGISAATVKRRWQVARGWLYQQMS